MKLLHVKAKHFKNCSENFEIDFVAKSKKQPKIKNMNYKRLQKDYTRTTQLHL